MRTVDEALKVTDSTSGQFVVAISGGIALVDAGALIGQGRRGSIGGYAALADAALLTAIVFRGQAWTEITSP